MAIRSGEKRCLIGNLWTEAEIFVLAPSAHAVDILGTNVHLLAPFGQKGGITICSTRVTTLSESTMKELRSALTDQLKKPDNPTPELANLLRKIGREAHQKQIRPEQLIIIFKQLWNSLAESLRPQNADQYERIRQRLVTLCIQAYYAE